MSALPTILSSREHLLALLALRASAGRRVGELLVASGKVSTIAVDAALQAQRAGNGARLGDVLVGMQAISRDELDEIVEQQTGVPLLDLRSYPVSQEALAFLSPRAANMYGCLPVDTLENSLIVAFAEMPSADQLAAVRFAGGGQAVIAFKATNAELLKTLIGRHYANPAGTFAKHSLIDKDKYQSLTSSTSSAAGFLRSLLAMAIDNGASDIHFRPLPDGTRRVFMRVDGMLRQLKDVTAREVSALVRHIEILSGIDFLSRTASKEGRLSVEHDSRDIDLRVSVIDSVSGDSVVLRVLDPLRFPESIEHLALPLPQRQALAGLLQRPHGLVVAAGPTGSGKTTTLYTILKELHARNLHVVTAEDPVEYRLPGINQFETRDFAGLLPKLLRHDPDVLMVGELRDEATVKMAMNAALTGHLVLSTVHANDAASTVHRLMGLGAESHVLSSCLAGILGQRLVRMTCVSCAGLGCAECGSSGYLGRRLVAELAKPLPGFSQLTGVPSFDAVSEQLEYLGGTTLDGQILSLAQSGLTTWQEATNLIANPRSLPADIRRRLGYSDDAERIPRPASGPISVQTKGIARQPVASASKKRKK